MTDNTQPLTPEQVVEMLEAADAANPSAVREMAEEMIRTGEVTNETTLDQLREILAARYPVKRQ